MRQKYCIRCGLPILEGDGDGDLCPKCRRETQATVEGESVIKKARLCKHCSMPILDGDTKCKHCGNPVD
ncbi:MAG: 60S ribosomal export protein NMD3 [Lachnospiraceae bacterium]|nr:60S ribosomal export protein NMD3 [Lachnospiraceae bacterium]